MVSAIERTLYQSGDTLLHRVDPRLKACACLLLVALAFAAKGWGQLMVPLLVVCAAAIMVSPLLTTVWRVCWMLRWLFVFTLLSYLFFSQGRTLFGVSWLSFDGLVMGSMVCVQMLLAVVAALLLSITTPIEELAGAFGWFIRPLHWFGCRTDEWQKILLLAMGFLPTVHEEISRSKSSSASPEKDSPGPGKPYWYKISQVTTSFVQRLLDRGEQVAHLHARGGEREPLSVQLPALLPLALCDKLFVLCLFLITFATWLTG